MTPHARHDRTVRLLSARLEEIARASERGGAETPELERSLLRARAATRHAVALQILSADEAGAIWSSAAARHPTVRWPELRPAA